jgi:chromosome segregation ATPase
MRTPQELFQHVRDVAAQCQVSPSGDVRVSGQFIQDILDTLAEVIRNQGAEARAELRMTRLPSVETRLARLEAAHFDDDGEWVSEPWRRDINRVSEGAQRDSADLHKRLQVIERRLVPPNPDGSWALLTTPEATTAIERLETELAEIRKHYGDEAYNGRHMSNRILAAEEKAAQADDRSRTIVAKVSELDRGLKQLQAQWTNLRNRIKALLFFEA